MGSTGRLFIYGHGASHCNAVMV